MSELDLEEIATEVYLYLYPIVTMEVTRRQILQLNKSRVFTPTENRFSHSRKMFTDKWRTVARSNVDTLMSGAWIDLSAGPALMTLPPSADRYHMFQLLDMWTDTYAVVGTRTTGNNGAFIKIVGPGDSHETKGDTDAIIKCPTNTTWIIGRTYTKGGDDVTGAHAFLDKTTLVAPTSEECDESGIEVKVDVPPVTQVESFSTQQFFEFGSYLMNREGTHGSDGSVLLRMRHLEFESEEQFSFSSARPEVKSALENAPTNGRKIIQARNGTSPFQCWTAASSAIGYYGNDYVGRAIIARYGLGANPPEDAIYVSSTNDSENRILDGANTYKLHFPSGDLPPAHSFWSITAYDQTGFLMSNELDRFNIGSRDDFKVNDDGSLDIFTGPRLPAGLHESNWIPTVPGTIDLSIRLYTPQQKYRDGKWSPPLIQKID